MPFFPFHRHFLVVDHIRKALLRLDAERLITFGRVDPGQANFVLFLFGVKHGNAVAISDANYAAGEFGGADMP